MRAKILTWVVRALLVFGSLAWFGGCFNCVMSLHTCEGFDVEVVEESELSQKPRAFYPALKTEVTASVLERAIADYASTESFFSAPGERPQQQQERAENRYIIILAPENEIRAAFADFSMLTRVTILSRLYAEILASVPTSCATAIKFNLLFRLSARANKLGIPLSLLSCTRWGTLLILLALVLKFVSGRGRQD